MAGLEAQSIWVDEGFSVDFASRTAADMTAMWKARGGVGAITDPEAARAANDPLAIAVDIHPPLYYLVLHEWLPFAGRGEYAVRFPSVIVGTLLVLLLYRLGASLATAGVGLAAAAVGATAPFYVAYSQEARMYAPVALFSAFSLYFTWRVIRGGKTPSPAGAGEGWGEGTFIQRFGRASRSEQFGLPWLGLVVTSSLALYTHYSAVLVIGAENLLVLSLLLARAFRPRRLLASWAAAQLVQLALFFPWLRTTIGQVAKYNENLWVPNWQHELTETFRAFDAGLWLPPTDSVRLAIPITAVLVAGSLTLALSRRDGRGDSRPLLFAAGALLFELLLALAAFQIRPEFHPRYLMVLATPYYLLLGLALAAVWRRWWPAGVLAGAMLAAVFAIGLRGYESDPNFAKDDTRTLAQYLASRTTAEDVIFLDAPEPLGYYYHGPAQLFSIPGDETTVAGAMTAKAAGMKRVVFVQWFLSTSDPEQLLPFLLQKYGRLVDDHTFRGYRERTYAIPPNTSFELGTADRPASANFDNILWLEGAGFGPSANGDQQLLGKLSQPLAVSGEKLMLELKWRLPRAVSKDYKVTAYLTDDRGHLAGQVDLLLRHGQAATSRWAAGEQATAYYVLQTLPGIMPGRYNVNLAVYPDGEQERLSVLDAAGAPGGGSAAIGAVDVLPPAEPVDLAGLGVPKPLNQPVAPSVSMIGYDLASSSVFQGDALHLTLFWQATSQPAANVKTSLALVREGQAGSIWQMAAEPRFPTTQWRAGNAFRDWYDPVLPAQIEPGAYQLLAGMGDRLVPLTQIQVQERTRTFASPTPEHRVRANVGGSIELLGYDQDKPAYGPGSPVRITLYWRGAAPMPDSYTAFVHVLDAGRRVVSQVDSVPEHGQLPTTAWLPGEVVQDTYELPLKPDLAPGTYQLEVGFYRGDTGMRLKASSRDVQAIDDGLLVGPLKVTK
ncbi:MAG TPA: glycosyltransferase family 39 protein [Chloroflexota bacterium]|nr:glycosyltransferase family 39 protein [Chloroflexota bacterium]